MEDHPAKRRRIEEPAEAAQATVAQTREAGQPSSRYAGVYWSKRERRWQASIRHEGRNQHLGYFDEEQDIIDGRQTPLHLEGTYLRPDCT